MWAAFHTRIEIRTIQLLIVTEKFFPRIWTGDLPGTKPMCYQLSYPGLDMSLLYLWYIANEVVWQWTADLLETIVPNIERKNDLVS